MTSTSAWSEPSGSRAIERIAALVGDIAQAGEETELGGSGLALVELETEIAAEQGLALVGNAVGDRPGDAD